MMSSSILLTVYNKQHLEGTYIEIFQAYRHKCKLNPPFGLVPVLTWGYIRNHLKYQLLLWEVVYHPTLSWDNSYWSSKNRSICTITRYWQARNYRRNDKDTQRDSEPGTPNISPRSFFWTWFLAKTFSSSKLQ